MVAGNSVDQSNGFAACSSLPLQIELGDVGANKRVATLDVVPEVGERPLMEQCQLGRQPLLAFAFEHLEDEGQLRDLYRLAVDVDAVDVVEQNPLALLGRQPPFTGPTS